MKYVILTLGLWISLLVSAQESKWNVSYASAVEQAKITNRPIMLLFTGSDWCRPCILLKTTILEKPQMGAWMNEHVHLVWCDFPRDKKKFPSPEVVKQNEKLASQYNAKGEFPKIVFVSAEGKVLATTGYKNVTPDEYAAHLDALLNPSK